MGVRKKYKILITVVVIIFTITIACVMYFNRVPDRSIPKGDFIVSPAHGRVIHIEHVESEMVHFFKKDIENILDIQEMKPPYYIVVIEMNLKNIHAQRAPIDGEIIHQEHFSGAHKNAISSLNVEKLANINEKNFLVFKNSEVTVGVAQVAGIAARRIQSFVDIGDVIHRGDVYGRILLGSQVVVILPANVILDIHIGETLIDGESIIAQY